MKIHTEPSGHGFLDEIINILHPWEIARRKTDLPALAKLFATAGELYKKTAPYNMHANLTESTMFSGHGCANLAKRLENGTAGFEDISDLSHVCSHKLLSAMNC